MYQATVLLALYFAVATVTAQVTPPTLPTLPTIPTLSTTLLPSTCNVNSENQCGLVSANLQCERSCNNTQLCANVCLGGPVAPIGGIVAGATGCVCKEGFFRNKQGACVTLDVCLRDSINVVCTGANERQVDCTVLDATLKCEKRCNSTQVCANVCTSLLSGTLNGIGGVLGSLLGGVGSVQSGPPAPINGLSFLIGPMNGCACNDGFYRNQNGICVSLDLCANGTAIVG